MKTSNTSKPKLMFYCQHSVGLGHLTRSMVLAQALSNRFQVTFLNGGPLPSDFRFPSSIEVIGLPPLGMNDGHTLVSRDSKTAVLDAKLARKQSILQTFERLAPQVLLIELFPFGRKKFAFELLPLLKLAHRRLADRPLIVCSVRDILVNDRPDQQLHDDRAAWLCDRYFDAVLVHSDPRLAQLGESFRPRKPLRTPTHYTGFVARAPVPSATVPRGEHVLISAGGGIVGGELFRVAVESQKRFGAAHGRTMKLITGPFLPDHEWEVLRQLAANCDRIELIRSVPDLAHEMRHAAVSISQCGYNTAMDIIRARVPALVIPYSDNRENEQMNRAQRLAQLELLRVLTPSALSPERLHEEIMHTLAFEPSFSDLLLDGDDRSAQLADDLLLAHHGRNSRAPQAREADHVA